MNQGYPPGAPPPGAPPAGGYGPPPGQYGPPPGGGPPGVEPQGGSKPDPIGIVSLVFGVLSVVIGWCCYLAFVLGPVAIVCGIISIIRINGDPQLSGKGFAFGGIAGGIVGMLIVVALFFLGVALNVAQGM